MSTGLYTAIAIAIVALVTWLTRALPFLIFRKRELPKTVRYLGKVLPPAIMVTLVIVLNYVRSASGRAVMAIRDNRIAAESIGLNITRYKMIAFVISAALAGAAGALYGNNYSTLVASKFDYNTSILVLVFVVLGGLGNIRGSIIAATVLYILPEALRGFSTYRMFIYAILLISMMLITNNAKIKALLAGILSSRKNGKKEEVSNG